MNARRLALLRLWPGTLPVPPFAGLGEAAKPALRNHGERREEYLVEQIALNYTY